ncbi:DMT family transporter [Tolumonas osonensis]|uniref:Drug/metabolite transporter (DMT)-like permease n=1 Tax=Tolumonas osonensis TaxID=675874 RepID=A0A841GBR3_9GAMM|nr:DMT family transporter [Tolumonas osonensis]MBB6056584.1 drug/metabolite transporter (DMT)-like permease [Tolumonas osonensis]
MQANLMLLVTAAIWGFAFVAQRVAMDHMGPFSFNGVRFLLGAISLLPLIWLFSRKRAVATTSAAKTSIWLAGGVAGTILFVAAALQQVGLLYTTAAKAGFITGLYMILVPFLGLFLRHVTGLNAWLGAGIALIGLYLLSINADFTMSKGDFLMFIGAIFWACHILWIDFIGRRVNALQLSAVQFLFCGLLSLLVAFWQETPSLSSVLLAWESVLFASFISVGVAYTLQVVAQKKANPTHAAIIMSMEAVFAAVGGVVFLSESLPLRGWMGCALMMSGMLLSQIPLPGLKKAAH